MNFSLGPLSLKEVTYRTTGCHGVPKSIALHNASSFSVLFLPSWVRKKGRKRRFLSRHGDVTSSVALVERVGSPAQPAQRSAKVLGRQAANRPGTALAGEPSLATARDGSPVIDRSRPCCFEGTGIAPKVSLSRWRCGETRGNVGQGVISGTRGRRY